CMMRKGHFKSTFTGLVLTLLLLQAFSFAQDATPQQLELVRAPYIQSSTAHSVQLLWETTIPTRAFVQYTLQAPSQSNADFANANTLLLVNPQTRHHCILLGLQSSATYNYRVGAQGKVLFTGQFQTNKSAI